MQSQSAPEAHILPAWQRLVAIMASELHPDEYVHLLTPVRHSPLLAPKRAAKILNLVRFVALLFAILIPLWCIVDFAVFPRDIWVPLAIARFLVSAAFLFIVFYKSDTSLRHTYCVMCALFLVSCLFHLVSQHILKQTPVTLTGISSTVAAGYAFLPFVFIAGLSIFPLSMLESLALAGLILLTELVSLLLHDLSWTGFLSTFWLLFLLMGISILAGVSQLAFMMALVQQAVRDPLTACFTRRSGEELLNLQFAISYRSKTPLSLAFVDLDHFKSVNDCFGHEAGDAVLKQAAAAIMQTMRTGDMLTRWGGEEFLIIMPGSDIHQANTALDRLRLAGLGKRPDDKNITASIGIAECLRDGMNDQTALINLADHRMYLAKERGRNQIVAEG
ncbi:GGDEF domain-containing protein [Betaproteobacteria bacterium]|nr:GGDEF domain-containing protein [Betaproteobacteria bacterium]